MTAARSKVIVPAGFSPRLLRADAAALYVGFGREHFLKKVGAVFPPPLEIEGEKRWDVRDLDAAVDALKNPTLTGNGPGKLVKFKP